MTVLSRFYRLLPKLAFVLKGRSFSCAVRVLYIRHPERTLVHEAAFQTLSAASLVGDTNSVRDTQ
jgi:hypothetical protein